MSLLKWMDGASIHFAGKSGQWEMSTLFCRDPTLYTMAPKFQLEESGIGGRDMYSEGE